jgi:hypothetical protein
MKLFAGALALVALFLAPAAYAQEEDRVQIGAYADYFRLSQTKTNFAGLGGRLSFTAYRGIKLEGEMSYDFNQVFTEGFTNTSTGTVNLQRSNLRALHGLFGPKIELGRRGIIHPFITVKGGFTNFRFDSRPATFNTFASSVGNLRSQDLTGVFYPGGGLEGHLGPVGLRLDVGDEIYFSSGTHNNLRVAFGPYIRF